MKLLETQFAEPKAFAPGGGRVVSAATLSFVLFLLSCTTPGAEAQTKQRRAKPKPKADVTSELAKSAKELARLKGEFINATNDYQALLKKQLPGLEKNVARAQDQLTKLSKLFADGLISRKDLEASQMELGQAEDKVTEVHQAIRNADSRIADTLLEAEAEKTLAKLKPVPKGGMVSTAAMIRYNGGGAWVLSDAWKVQRFFLDAFQKPLPISVFGQGSIHVRWRLDHHNSMDVSLHPDGPEGQGLLNFLRTNGIPFLAFRQAIPGTATGAHIHIGRPSHRY